MRLVIKGFVTVALFFSCFIQAEQPVAWIKLKPRACAVDERAQCTLEVLVEYQSSIPSCLNVNDKRLKCTEVTTIQTFIYSYHGSEHLLFQLKDQQQNSLAQVQLPMLQLAKFRRRQRNPWSLF